MADWSLVKNIVKSQYKDYLPVPTIADVRTYRPLNFLNLRNGDSFASKWYEKPLRFLCTKTLPIFESVGNIENFAAAHPLEDGSFTSLPEIHEEKLGIHGEDARIKTTLEAQIAKHPPESAEGSMKTTTVLPCLGVISRHRIEYRDLREWLEKYRFLESAEDMRLEAKRGNLFIIYDVIMAEKLSFKGKNKQTIAGHISSFLKLNYVSKSYLDLERPPEFGPFPIAVKIGKINAGRSKHAAHSSAFTNRTAGSKPSSANATGIYRLKLEPLRDFSQSCRRRKFNKENSDSPSSDDSLPPPSSRAPKRARKDGSGSIEPDARKRLVNENECKRFKHHQEKCDFTPIVWQ